MTAGYGLAAGRQHTSSATTLLASLRHALYRCMGLLVPLGGGALLLAACIAASGRRHFWHDEVFSWILVTDPSLPHMLAVIAGGGEVAPPLYHLLARGWLRLAGSSELALRLFSSVGLSIALALTWGALRRYYPMRAAATGTLLVFGGSELLFHQNAEARFYGTFMAVCALGVLMFSVLSRRDVPTRALLVGNALVHAAIVLCHIFGILYSGSILLAHVLCDRRRGVWRPAVYLSVLLGWLPLLAWLPAMLAQAEIGRPHSWIPIPTLAALIDAYGFGITGWRVVLAAVLVLLAWEWWHARPATASHDARTATAGPNPLPWLAATFLLVPLITYVVSHLSMAIFLPRYLLPSMLGVAVLVAHGVASALPRATHRSGLAFLLPIGWAVLGAGLMTQPLRSALRQPANARPGIRAEILARNGLPIVTESPLEYLPASHYSASSERPYYFILDWESALDPRAARQATGDFKLMSRWRDFGYLATGIRASQEFLCSHSEFLVVDEPGFLWYERRVAADPAFASRVLATEEDRATGWSRHKRFVLVTRTPGAGLAGCGAPVSQHALARQAPPLVSELP